MVYRIVLTPDGDGFMAEVPELPGCMSDGDTVAEALANAADAIQCWIEACQEMGREVPAGIAQ